jgi:ATP-dependent DNA helicase PIF1
LIQGQTLHSFAGFPISVDLLDKKGLARLVEYIKNCPWKKKAYTKTDVLVIDEASMLHPALFDTINAVMKQLRHPDFRHLPFGGLQIIISGDFYQLPPVVRRRTLENENMNNILYSSQNQADIPYLFDSASWKELLEYKMERIELVNVFRQSEPIFLSILDELRRGACSESTWKILEEYRNRNWPNDGILVITCSFEN